jgi:hypothetical protein
MKKQDYIKASRSILEKFKKHPKHDELFNLLKSEEEKERYSRMYDIDLLYSIELFDNDATTEQKQALFDELESDEERDFFLSALDYITRVTVSFTDIATSDQIAEVRKSVAPFGDHDFRIEKSSVHVVFYDNMLYTRQISELAEQLKQIPNIKSIDIRQGERIDKTINHGMNYFYKK